MSTTTTFDLGRFTRAAETQLSMYAPDATVTILDRISQPSSPRVLHGRDEVREWLEDMFIRDMTHSVTHSVGDDAGAAYALACRYPDGLQVACTTVMALESGQIKDQTIIQVWDETE
jgi:hypothetical protein